MKIELLAVGKCRDRPIKDLLAEYGKRLQWPFVLKEVDGGRSATAAEQEKLLVAARPKEPHILIALDERGKTLSSEDFAARIEHWRDIGSGTLVFCIGGADGFSASFRENADFLLSFGKQTWPHMLVRVMMVEQLYRAQQILAGHPYHRS